jgi:hypothetical protein
LTGQAPNCPSSQVTQRRFIITVAVVLGGGLGRPVKRIPSRNAELTATALWRRSSLVAIVNILAHAANIADVSEKVNNFFRQQK